MKIKSEEQLDKLIMESLYGPGDTNLSAVIPGLQDDFTALFLKMRNSGDIPASTPDSDLAKACLCFLAERMQYDNDGMVKVALNTIRYNNP